MCEHMYIQIYDDFYYFKMTDFNDLINNFWQTFSGLNQSDYLHGTHVYSWAVVQDFSIETWLGLII